MFFNNFSYKDNLGKKSNSYRDGLTWIEIMVLTSVVFLMAVLICSTISKAGLRSQDAKLILAVKEFSTAIELHRLKTGTIPQLHGYVDGHSNTYKEMQKRIKVYLNGPLMVMKPHQGNGEYNNTSQTSDYSVGDNDPMTYSLRFVSMTGNIYCLTSSQIFQLESGEGRESKCVQG